MRSASVSCALALSLAAMSARADVTQPHGGMTLVRHANSAMVIANLCAPGVSMRATRYAERQATPQAWAQGIGAQAAINADFFDFPGWSYILVRARGAGEEWPAYAEKLEQPSGYWQFGPGFSGLEPNSLVTPPASVTDAVGAYDPLISAGQPVDQSTNPFMLEFHRRSAIGLSADRATVYLYASNASIDAPGMIGDMIALAAEGGAPPIADATNQDGGGSSQLYVDGLGQVIDSGRQVNTHLGIFASGSGPAPNCPNHPPAGTLDGAGCDAIHGAASDPDEPQKSIAVHVYFDGVPGEPQAQGIPVSTDAAHAFSLPPPLSRFDGKPHAVHAYGIDSTGGNNPELANSPRTMTCTPPPLKGVKRWIHSPDVMTAWHFSWLEDVMLVSDQAIASLAEESQLPDVPALVRADDGSPEIWVIDGDLKRHIPDPTVAAAWHFDLGSSVVKPASYVASLKTGMPLRARPVAIQGTGPAVYLVDDPHDAVPNSGDAGDASTEPNAPASSSNGCGCRAAGSEASTLGFWPLALTSLLGARRWLRANRRA